VPGSRSNHLSGGELLRLALGGFDLIVGSIVQGIEFRFPQIRISTAKFACSFTHFETAVSASCNQDGEVLLSSSQPCLSASESSSSNLVLRARSLFKWRQFEPEMILLAVGWYLRFSLSYRDVEELLAERGLRADHAPSLLAGCRCFTPSDEILPASKRGPDALYVTNTVPCESIPVPRSA
jgi:hypothetical protein